MARHLAIVVFCALVFSGPALVSASASAADARSLPKVAPGDWPWWRGPTLHGKSADRLTVTKWSPTENVIWKTPGFGCGHSSPIVCGDRVFLTTADDQAQKQFLLAFDRTTGKVLWTRQVHQGDLLRKNGKNTHALATPASDGSHVFSVFVNHGGLHVTATNLDGTIVWQTKAGDFNSEHGYGSSPVLYGPLVIVNGDNLKDCFIMAKPTSWRLQRLFGLGGRPAAGRQ